MSTAEERRADFVDSIEKRYRGMVQHPDSGRYVVGGVYDKLLAHLDETDPKVAHALRYGIHESVPVKVLERGLERFPAHMDGCIYPSEACECGGPWNDCFWILPDPELG